MLTPETNAKIDYLLRFHESLQTRTTMTENQATGTVNLTVVVAGIAFLTSNSINHKLCYLLIPMCILVVMSIQCYYNRASAIMRGCLAGVEDILSQLMGVDIFCFNHRYKIFYHQPLFFTNDWMGPMYGVFAFAGSIYSFYRIYMDSIIPFAFLIIYISVFIVFGGIYMFELWTNDKIKELSRSYYRMQYTSNQTVDINDDFINSLIRKQYKFKD